MITNLVRDRTLATCAPVAGNVFDKYGSRSAIVRALMRSFLRSVRECIAAARPATVLDVGCATGELAERLFWAERSVPVKKGVIYYGIDTSAEQIARAKRRHGVAGKFQVAQAEMVPFPDSWFDLVLACEVLEHLAKPEIAVMEFARVTRKFVLISVPWEPIWRILNCARGAYLLQIGNTPGHIQHFGRRKIRALVAPYFEILKELHPFPWTMLLLQKRHR